MKSIFVWSYFSSSFPPPNSSSFSNSSLPNSPFSTHHQQQEQQEEEENEREFMKSLTMFQDITTFLFHSSLPSCLLNPHQMMKIGSISHLSSLDDHSVCHPTPVVERVFFLTPTTTSSSSSLTNDISNNNNDNNQKKEEEEDDDDWRDEEDEEINKKDDITKHTSSSIKPPPPLPIQDLFVPSIKGGKVLHLISSSSIASSHQVLFLKLVIFYLIISVFLRVDLISLNNGFRWGRDGKILTGGHLHHLSSLLLLYVD